MLAPSEMLKEVAIGNDAGWVLTFHVEEPSGKVCDRPALTISGDDYYASIEAALPEGLGGGKYKFQIEGMTDEHHAAISPASKERPTVVRLHLFWRDANASIAGYLANLTGLTGVFGNLSAEALAEARVAELTVTRVARKAGKRRYETTIEARERVFTRLRGHTVEKTLGAATIGAAVERIANDVGVAVDTHGFDEDGSLPSGSGAAPGDDAISFDAGVTYAKALEEVAKAIENITRHYGRGVVLIRDGKLIVGVRPIPPGVAPHTLTHRTGLIASEPLADAAKPGPCPPKKEKEDLSLPEKSRRQFKLTLKGRPDIKTSDVIFLHLPPEEAPTRPASALGAVTASFRGPPIDEAPQGRPATLYVNSVEHLLSREKGFVTTLVGVDIAGGAWDKAPDGGSKPDPEKRGNRGESANRAADVARRVRKIAATIAAALRMPEIAEVRQVNTAGTGPQEPPAQTLGVWRGLEPPDGRGGQARRLSIRRRDPARFDGVPYASPFAWGRCGLVLPRYPGTRALLVHRNGEPRDPVEVGAVWESGHAPESKPGDWWLILPVGVEESARASAADEESPPPEHNGATTNDLIDAEGRRVIEVGELTVRVGREGLPAAGTRPRPGEPAGAITIEHTKKGAKIVVAEDGSITLEAEKSIELKSRDGDIKLEAKNVFVDVETAMEVT